MDMKRDEFLAFFTNPTILSEENGHLILKQDDTVMEVYLKTIDMYGYDEYLDDIRSMVKLYTQKLVQLVDHIETMKKEENEVVFNKIITKLCDMPPFGNKCVALNKLRS